ncbi:MAG TPA: chemotaxis protein CheA [Leptolyngbya sp.]|nr:chemotaxis protein CheA [Leptolyngbya sp.]
MLDAAESMERLDQIDDEDLKVFLVESYEILDRFEQEVLSLKTHKIDQAQLNQLYRALHTIKGNSGFVPFPKLEAIAHAGETLLETIRTGGRKFTPEVAAALLQLTDTVRGQLQTIEATKTESDQPYSGLIATLAALCTSTQVATRLESSEIADIHSAAIDPTIRVRVDLLDQVMDLVGELVLARNRMLQPTAATVDPSLLATYQQIDLITNELQNSVMRTRMQPISTLWRSLPRLVRDLAMACDKDISLEMEGGDTELDRNIASAIKDPLTHLVRNCVDHGIERSNVRLAAGKSAQSILKLRAFQASGRVVLELWDDGAGIDVDQIKARSQQLGLISATQAASMRDRDALDLIFLPGFSTATEVTRLSGRGVGLDVVRRNLESVNGTVEVESKIGQGTVFRLKVPLTLAIIPILLVSSRGQHFAIPQMNVQELIRIEGKEEIDRSIETLLNVPVYRLREQILPLVNLAAVLELSQPTQTNVLDTNILDTNILDTDLLYFVVVKADSHQYGLMVDRIEDTQDIVVKPLSQQLKSLEMFSGATVLGNGNIALILDMIGLGQYAGVQPQASTVILEIEPSDRQLILLVLGQQNSRFGIILAQATRLEMIPSTTIEQVGEQYLMQHHDRIVSLIDLQTVFTGNTRALSEFEETLSIVVITLDHDRTVGLIVHQILDIVEESLTITGTANRPGVQYYAAVQGQITEILDLDAIVDLAHPQRELMEAKR